MSDEPKTKTLPIEVDQKGLIDKILARYSSRFAVLRELLQNADDASACKVEIHATTDKESNISSWIIKNTGNAFTEEDWQRLRTIASGNPDSDKIGAFGVGFYSVFSITSAPQVCSGTEGHRLHWGQDNKLYITQLSHPVNTEPWATVITLPVENHDRMSGKPLEIGRFLAASLPFMSNIKSVKLEIDSIPVLSLEKCIDSSSPTAVIPSQNGLGSDDEPMFGTTVENIKEQIVRLHVEARSCDQEPLANVDIDQDVILWTALIKTKPIETSKSELKTATKKSIPESSSLRIARNKQSNHDSCPDRVTFELFHTKVTDPHMRKSSGYVYIGHATSQTTGFAGHVSGHFIPTVEREHLDLENNVYVKGWNKQLLYRVGYLARAIYDHELNVMKAKGVSLESARPQFIRLLQFFKFEESRPHLLVSTSIQNAFFTCKPHPEDISLLTQHGVLPITRVRDYDPGCIGFLKKLTMLDEDLASTVKEMMGSRAELLQSVSFSDVIGEVKSRPLEETELAACLSWVLSNNSLGLENSENRRNFTQAVKFKHGGRIVALSDIKSILDVDITPCILPQTLPRYTLPYQISSAVSQISDLKSLFATHLSVDQWLQHYCSHNEETQVTDPNRVTPFIDILDSLFKHWQGLAGERGQVKSILAKSRCIPTQKGMCFPKDAYISQEIASSFPSLPVVDLTTGWTSASWEDREVAGFFLDIGVRNKIDLNLLPSFVERWDNHKLLQYLLQHEMTETELLRTIPLFTARPTQAGRYQRLDQRFKANQLHAQTDEKMLKLDLNMTAWAKDMSWDIHSEEVQLFQTLGIRDHPEFGTLITRASELKYNSIAFPYLMDLLSRETWSEQDLQSSLEQYANVRFIPVESTGQRDGTLLATMTEVYSDPGCALLKFLPISNAYRDRAGLRYLQLREYPKPVDLVNALKKIPLWENTASECFRYLVKAGFLGSSPELKDLPFVPFNRGGVVQYIIKPSQCYLKKSSESPHYEKLFPFVDFGDGNDFLRCCGAKGVPSLEEIAAKLLQEPDLFNQALGENKINYMEELSKISALPKKTILTLYAGKPALLGYDYISHIRANNDVNVMNDTTLCFLLREQIVIMDNELLASAFPSAKIYYAPRSLERLYENLECANISDLVDEKYTPNKVVSGDPTGGCANLRSRILERLPLYIRHGTSQRERLDAMKDVGTFRVDLYSEIIVTKPSASKALDSVTRTVTTVKASCDHRSP